MDLGEIGWEGGGVEWIYLVQDSDRWWALMNMVMNQSHENVDSILLNNLFKDYWDIYTSREKCISDMIVRADNKWIRHY
jgi:hypothetical protein